VLNQISVSSTKIRQALKNSDIETANQLLGYSFFFEGIVEHGDKLGRELGYPTANLQYTDPDKIHLGAGVYAALALVKGQWKKAMLSIGTRPTVSEGKEKVEVFLFAFNGDLYGEKLKVQVEKYLRPQIKFDDLDALKLQMKKDEEDTLRFFSSR
jgi:riboflavin kinase/FMN adenylyltransferase